MLELSTQVQFIKGIGPKRAEELAAREIFSVQDLLYYLPYRYEDRSRFTRVADLKPGERASILVEVLTSGMVITRRSRSRIFDLAARDNSGIVRCKWFHSDYLERRKVFSPGQKVIFYGRFEADPYGSGNLQIVNPEFEIIGDGTLREESFEMGRIVPVYEAIKGCSSRLLRRIIHGTLEQLPEIDEVLPADVVERRGLLDRNKAIRHAHFPPSTDSMDALDAFRSPSLQRLIFEELFFLEAGLALKRRRVQALPGYALSADSPVREALKKMLPFRPTGAQKRVLKEIVDDLRRQTPMNRMLQGDVGCGKTIVALEAAVVAMESGFQVAVMVPTEILAEQHFFNARNIFSKNGYGVALLKGGLKKSERGRLLGALASGEIQVLIGTHALLEPAVEFHKLGLVIIDEQHRFGVIQRLHLKKKGYHPHTLVMTATPIPRTLAMTLYGDLDVSVIDELPPNRSPIATRVVLNEQRMQAYQFIREQIAQGRQVYVVCPLIEESEKIDLRAAEETFTHLSRQVFPSLRVGLLHGRMKSAEKEEAMVQFIGGKTQILVSTTVIEVGVDVPNASVMMIEHAERFGLAQLHQLRGRIGRGKAKSYCLLMSGKKVTAEAEQRLRCMVDTSDGFKIAEKDLEIRGPGEFFGTRQSGVPALRVANLVRDRDILETARREALNYVEHPPSQEDLREFVARMKVVWPRHYGLVGVG